MQRCNTNLTKCHSEIEELKTKQDDYETQIIFKNNKINELSERIQESENKINLLTDENAELKKRRKIAKEKLNQMNSRSPSANRDISNQKVPLKFQIEETNVINSLIIDISKSYKRFVFKAFNNKLNANKSEICCLFILVEKNLNLLLSDLKQLNEQYEKLSFITIDNIDKQKLIENLKNFREALNIHFASYSIHKKISSRKSLSPGPINFFKMNLVPSKF